jgi:hypothetical protein
MTQSILSKLEDINEECHSEVLKKWQLAESEDSEALRVAASDAQATHFKDLVYGTLTNEDLLEIKDLLENDGVFQMQFSDWFKTSYEEQQNIEYLFDISPQISSLLAVPFEVFEAIDLRVWSPDSPIWFQNWFSVDCEDQSSLTIWQIEWIKHRTLEMNAVAKSWLENGEIDSDELNEIKVDIQRIFDFFNKTLKSE